MSRVTTIPQVIGLQGQMIPRFQGQIVFWCICNSDAHKGCDM